MSDTYIVGFDETDASHRAATLAAGLARTTGARVHLVHVLEWSAYSFLTQDELAERHKRREEELKRAESVVAPVAEALAANGVQATSEIRYGHAGEIFCEIAEKLGNCQIFIGRKGSRTLAERLLGGLAITLVQVSPVPVTVVP
ncbi:universal stress protein family protein [Stappia aggregata IAM 12614]|uniref:Universal stress protein family protein n=1 Tax=Roseibium aggregatum (strain ATCC 25650 / DSM 13394 / JCM 20685 / NBRC 16684 / NCIMB 2208 / IAM 12614 / B1) TaxID=384765 RepID=A0P2L5_ROSAI|nr:universal stress protein [Roseibium aggregatum]EAV40668.1 universal stress protein family protein [Stappia aggregata IAM 12614] [Roseibium aggregatum IAM 12614]